MSTVPIRKLTAEDYLAIERQAEFKSEFYRCEMFAMAGGPVEFPDSDTAVAGMDQSGPRA